MFKKMLPFLAGLFVGAILLVVIGDNTAPRKVHYTKAPLLLYSNAQNPTQMMLPTGTALYYDTSFDEGFSRYLVYINTKADIDLSVAPFGRIAPLDARPLRTETLLRAVKEHPLTRQDLEKILRSDSLSKDDIKAVLSGFLETEK